MKLKNKAAILPASGLGDALIMMIAAHHLKKAGYDVSIFHHHIADLSHWFEKGFSFVSPDLFESQKDQFSFIILQNDNSSKITTLKKWREKNDKALAIFYPTYQQKKHGPLEKHDFVFDAHLPMAKNVQIATSHLLKTPLSSCLDICPPDTKLKNRKYAKRIVIQPTSQSRDKNWKKASYLALYHALRSKGFHPVICVSEQEWRDWKDVDAECHYFKTVSDFASFLYEANLFVGNDSGGGHLASLLNIPSIIVASDKRQMQLWQPGWRKAHIVFPPRWVPNIKGLRLKKTRWQHFISVNRVLRVCQKILLEAS